MMEVLLLTLRYHNCNMIYFIDVVKTSGSGTSDSELPPPSKHWLLAYVDDSSIVVDVVQENQASNQLHPMSNKLHRAPSVTLNKRVITEATR